MKKENGSWKIILESDDDNMVNVFEAFKKINFKWIDLYIQEGREGIKNVSVRDEVILGLNLDIRKMKLAPFNCCRLGTKSFSRYFVDEELPPRFYIYDVFDLKGN